MKYRPMKKINRESFSEFLSTFLKENSLRPRRFAEAIGCSEPTVHRLLQGQTLPSGEMVKQAELMSYLGFETYCTLSKAQRKNLSDKVGSVGGGAFGVASIPFLISSAGTVSGLSAAGITSGLAAIGGTMIGGAVVVAALPLAVGIAGIATVHGITSVATNKSLKKTEIDKRWEILRNVLPEASS
jgi:hypothetical protein